MNTIKVVYERDKVLLDENNEIINESDIDVDSSEPSEEEIYDDDEDDDEIYEDEEDDDDISNDNDNTVKDEPVF